MFSAPYRLCWMSLDINVVWESHRVKVWLCAFYYFERYLVYDGKIGCME